MVLMAVQLDSVRSENTLGRYPSEDDTSFLGLVASLGDPRMSGAFSGAIGSGGSFTSTTCCLGTVGGLVVIRSIGVEDVVEVEVIVGFFFLCAVLLAFLCFRGAMVS